jgi:hypothetical protein
MVNDRKSVCSHGVSFVTVCDECVESANFADSMMVLAGADDGKLKEYNREWAAYFQAHEEARGR